MRRSTKTRARHPELRAIAAVLACLIAIVMAGVLVAACGGTGAATTTAAGPGTTGGGGANGAQVVLKGFAFDPADVTIKAGESVTWTNQDSVTHDVTADNGEFHSGSMPDGKTFSFIFAEAGTYPYHCGIHPTMKGTVTVQ